MLPLNPWEHQNVMKAFYSKCVEGVCEKHKITRMELDILLFLANNPLFDTASDIVEIRYLSKSQVSLSIKLLEKKGFFRKEYQKGNHKTVHLFICKAANEVVEDGKKAQEKFLAILFQGMEPEEMEAMKRWNEHIWRNINQYMKEDKEDV